MAKKANVKTNALQAVLDRQVKIPAPVDRSEPKAEVRHDEVKADVVAAKRAKARDGKHLLGGHFEPEVVRAVKVLAAEEGTTVQALLGEAVDLLMVKRGRGSIVNRGRG